MTYTQYYSKLGSRMRVTACRTKAAGEEGGGVNNTGTLPELHLELECRKTATLRLSLETKTWTGLHLYG